MKKLQFIDIGKPFRIIGKICKDIERAFRFKGINVNFIVMMIDYIGFAFILKWNLQPSFAPTKLSVRWLITGTIQWKSTCRSLNVTANQEFLSLKHLTAVMSEPSHSLKLKEKLLNMQKGYLLLPWSRTSPMMLKAHESLESRKSIMW